jgi:hypothetical protein
MLIQEGRQGLILERFTLHNMTPMACGVADAEEYRFVLSTGLAESLFAPRMPINRVMLMAEQIRRLLKRQTVRPDLGTGVI